MTAAPQSPQAPEELHVLVVDDDQRIRGLLRRFLAEQGFRVSVAADAGEARALMAGLAVDVIVLDVMLPGESGLELLAWIKREGPPAPVLLLTARGEAEDRVEGLERGADDYLPKPFEPRELVLRLRNLGRRPAAAAAPARPGGLRFGDAAFDPERGLVTRGGAVVTLTQSEAQLLAAFAARPGVVLTRDDLAEMGVATGQGRLVDVQVTRLRRKIEPDPHFPRYLQTVRGKGYVLRPD